MSETERLIIEGLMLIAMNTDGLKDKSTMHWLNECNTALRQDKETMKPEYRGIHWNGTY